MSIQILITSSAAQVLQNLKAFPATMAKAIAHALDLQNEITIGYIQKNKLSKRGPTTLGVITNRFRASINRSNAVVSGDSVKSSIGSNVVYAGVHELGFDGDVQVHSFTRKEKRRDQYQTNSRGTRKQTASGVARVRDFTRHMKMPARAPIQTSIKERQGEYTSAVSGAILTAWNGGTQ